MTHSEPTLVPFAESDDVGAQSALCDGWILYGFHSFAQLVSQLRALQAADSDHRMLASLDQRYQADYTSGHTVQTHDLDFVRRADAPNAPEEWFEGEEEGYLEGREGFAYRLGNLLSKSEGISLDEAAGFLPWIDEHVEGNDPVTLNRDPDIYLMLDRQKDIEVQRVPVERAADALAAFPNGYFTSDLNPMQNHALAVALGERFGLDLFGVGAGTLGFWREDALSECEAATVAGFVCALYCDRPVTAEHELATALAGKRELLVRYSES